jgi:molybdopterin molybdotransferase
MKNFFTVTPLHAVFEKIDGFPVAGGETVPLCEAHDRILAENIVSDMDIPGFARSTVDGYAVCAASTFGASETNPAYLTLKGGVAMGKTPDFSVSPGEAGRISTGGMLPSGSNSVVMLEHATEIDAATLEVYKSVPPMGNVIAEAEDINNNQTVLFTGMRIRPQETGLLAALGKERVRVFKKPVIGLISTGDEIVNIHSKPGPAQIRDINTHTLFSQILRAGGVAKAYGIVVDDRSALLEKCRTALAASDMVMISGGSSVGTRDLTIEVIVALPDSEILIHGISISPGKPTILARVGEKPFWGLPGHVASAMVVFDRVVRPFVAHAGGVDPSRNRRHIRISAKLSRNLASAQGRTDFVRVRLTETDEGLLAEPILGKSGLIHTMLRADGLIEVDANTEGVEKGAPVSVIPFL